MAPRIASHKKQQSGGRKFRTIYKAAARIPDRTDLLPHPRALYHLHSTILSCGICNTKMEPNPLHLTASDMRMHEILSQMSQSMNDVSRPQALQPRQPPTFIVHPTDRHPGIFLAIGAGPVRLSSSPSVTD